MDNQKLDPYARKPEEKGRCLMRVWINEQNMIGVETVPGMPIDSALDLLNKAMLTMQGIKREQQRKSIKPGIVESMNKFFSRFNARPS